MEQDKFTLKLNASRLGTIREVTSMLSDLDSAYNNLYMFNIIVESISERNRSFTQINDSVYPYYRNWYNDLPPKIQRSVAPYHMLVKNNIGFQDSFQEYLSHIARSLDANEVIYPEDRLIVTKVNIQSPGWWEVVGKLNPLVQSVSI